MNQYQDMYYRLFNKMTDIIKELQQIQIETEELFLSQNQEGVPKPESEAKCN